jgi:MCP family monocarboxylic acid transporter-like MFS transporter 10
MIQRLIPRIGFGWSMRVLFFIEIVMLTIAWFTIRTRLPPAIDVRDKSKGGWSQVKWIDMHAFKSPAYTMIVIGFGLVVFGLYTPFVSWYSPSCCGILTFWKP